MNRTVNVLKRVTTAKGSRYCAVVEAGNGRIKPNYVIVDGKQEFHKEGAYYLSWYEGKKVKRMSVGTEANVADARRHKQEQILGAKAAGIKVVEEKAPDSPLLVNATAEYLAEITAQKKSATAKSYRNSIRLFTQSCSKQTLAEIDRKDLLAFITYLRDQKFTPYTVRMRFSIVFAFLNEYCGWVKFKKEWKRGDELIFKQTDWPQYTEAEPEVYEREELDKLFAACDPQEHLWFSFFLMTGMREQEVMYATWKAVDFQNNTISVRHNPQHGWQPKAYKERTIPVPQALIDELKASKRQGNCDLLFPTFRCKPQTQFWDKLKVVAERADLDPETFWLHKFRATFCTGHLRSGSDLRTVMSWMGHSDIASTMRYLKPNGGPEVRSRVEAAFK